MSDLTPSLGLPTGAVSRSRLLGDSALLAGVVSIKLM